jgi:hypothetical protein
MEYEAIRVRIELHDLHRLEAMLRWIAVERENELRGAPEQHRTRIFKTGVLQTAARKDQGVVSAQIRRQLGKQFLDTAHVLCGDGLTQ